MGENPKIVDAMHVIGVRVGNEERVDPLDPRAKGLYAEFRTRVDEYGLAIVASQQGACARSRVPRVR
jgi:hypothetical protein